MITSFDAWLQQLSAAGKGGSALDSTDIPTATRGEAWSMPIAIPGDWSTATLSGSISAAPDAPTPLVTLSLTSGSYDSASGYTTWTASLASGTGTNSTGALPSDTDGDGIEWLPLMVRITPAGGTAMTLFGGAFPIVGKV